MKTAASWVQIWRIGEFGSDMIGLAAAIQRDAAEAQREADKVLFGDAVREWETQPSSEAQSLASAHFDRYRAAMGMRPLVTDAAAGAKGEK
jgi:hypothetical protein